MFIRNCSVPSQLRVKMHSKSPSVMAFCLVCLGILAKSCQNTSRDTTYWIVTFIHFFNILKSACNTNNFIIQYYCYYILLELSILGFLSLGVTAEIITLFLMIIQIVIALKGEMPMCSNNKLVVYGAYGVVNLSILLKILVQARLGGSNPPRPDYYRLPFATFFYVKRHQPLSQCLNL